nr:unnamed protein product [Callosobruchus analis]
MSQHPETEGGSNLIICGHCNITFKSKQTLDDHTIRTHPDFIASVSGKIHECTYCTYKTSVKSHFDRHIMKHSNTKLNICVHCNTTYKSKKTLDDHTVRKHRQSTALISRKIYECTCCAFKTVMKSNLARHMLKHPELADSDNLSRCIHCKATYKSKTNLDDHTLKQHPDFIATVSSKLHKCTYCTYQTTIKFRLTQHLNKHAKTKLRCTDCNAKFTNKKNFDNHTLRKHPHLIATITRKLHKCTYCAYQTVLKANFDRHLLTHPEAQFMCTDCNAIFTNKKNLDDHTLRKHPHLIATITRKLHKCTYCAYQTVLKANFDRHLLTHPETVNKCVHCNATYKSKRKLDEHVVRKHPNYIASISRKMHECIYCTYKSTMSSSFAKHMLKHPSAQFMCTACNAIFTTERILDDHRVRKHPHLIATINRKLHKCIYCAYQTILKANCDRHVLTHLETGNNYKFNICVHCNAKFKRKASLDDHTLRKHPDFMASVSCKVYECAHCTYKTVMKATLVRHMTVNNYKFKICVHCNLKYKHKFSLDDHTLRKHPDLIATISSKIHECTYCTYKTTRKSHWIQHLNKHAKTKLVCLHCNAKYKSKQLLDYHILRKHPNAIASVSSKIHECTHCTYKTTLKSNFSKHMLKHSEAVKICVYCNAKHKSKRSLDEHVIRQHPNFISSITSKLHQCTYCTYKSTLRNSFAKHMLKHPEAFQICVHCNAKHKSKRSLDEHVIRKHPNSVASITSKIHECTYCTYKSTVSTSLAKHMLKHPEAVNNCNHCNAKFKNKISLDNHTIRYHPNFVASVTRKVHECPCCTYKTTLKGNLHKHMLIHPEAKSVMSSIDKHMSKHSQITNKHKSNTCSHCNATFKRKESFDDRAVRKHPDLVASISSKTFKKYTLYT